VIRRSARQLLVVPVAALALVLAPQIAAEAKHYNGTNRNDTLKGKSSNDVLKGKGGGH